MTQKTVRQTSYDKEKFLKDTELKKNQTRSGDILGQKNGNIRCRKQF